MVVNSLSFARTAMATVRLELPAGWPGWLELTDDTGRPVPFLAEGVSGTDAGGLAAVTITFRAADVPGVGYRSYLVRPSAAAPEAGWQPAGDTATVENASPARARRPGPRRHSGPDPGQADRHRAALAPRGGGNELLLQPEHPAHPRWAEGPWLLCPAGPPDGAASRPACGHGGAVPGRQRGW